MKQKKTASPYMMIAKLEKYAPSHLLFELYGYWQLHEVARELKLYPCQLYQILYRKRVDVGTIKIRGYRAFTNEDVRKLARYVKKTVIRRYKRRKVTPRLDIESCESLPAQSLPN